MLTLMIMMIKGTITKINIRVAFDEVVSSGFASSVVEAVVLNELTPRVVLVNS
jgi:hypothetical protein